MKRIRNERGVALGIALLLAAIGIALAAGLLYIVSRWASVSGMEKKYKTALEAGKGGASAAFQIIGARGINPGIDNVGLTITATGACMGAKLTQPTALWGACSSSLTIDTGDAASYDLRINLGGYTAYAKIVDTVEGNSGAAEGLVKTGVVTSSTGEVTVMSMPYLYTVEVLSQSTANPNERSRVSTLYQY